MITWCCKPDCPGRHPACHGTCEKYKAWAAAAKAEKAYTKDSADEKNNSGSPWQKDAGGFGDSAAG